MSRYEAFVVARRHAKEFYRSCAVLMVPDGLGLEYEVAFSGSETYARLLAEGCKEVTVYDAKGVQIFAQ